MIDKSGGPTKLSRGELITALVHYYRAEVQRSLAWRERLDLTTNWAVGSTAAVLGFGFSHPEYPHVFFLFGLAIVYILLYVESRRYRFYDAYEYRVRLLHQNFVYGALTGELDLEKETFWVAELASDLMHPQYKMGRRHALGRRLHANYIYLFAVLLSGWLFKVKIHPEPSQSWHQFVGQAAIGELPGWVVLLCIFLFVLHLAVLAWHGRKPQGGRDVFYSPAPRPATLRRKPD
ncbi:DUF2270 domain-containing protein [Trichloromonas sp.]|uniref:DUF2270 domain-containing protein n=1 Tax=Trichloromonas sp. TaxID=3069249 RepID=UPI003D819468